MRDDVAREMLTITAVARRLGCARGTVRSMLERGELPGVRFARRSVRIPAPAVDGILESIVEYLRTRPNGRRREYRTDNPFAQCWPRLVSSLSNDDFEPDRAPATLQRIAQLAVAPTGTMIEGLGVSTVYDRSAAIALIAGLTDQRDTEGGEDLVREARRVWAEFKVRDALVCLVGDASQACGDSARPPTARSPAAVERFLATAMATALLTTVEGGAR